MKNIRKSSANSNGWIGAISFLMLAAICPAAMAQNEGIVCAQQGWGTPPASCNSNQAAIYALNAKSQCQWFCVDHVTPDLPKDPAMRTPFSTLPIFEQTSDGSYQMVPRCTNGCPPSIAQLEVTIGDRICPKRCTAKQKLSDSYFKGSGSNDSGSDNDDSNADASNGGGDCGTNCKLYDWASRGASGAALSSFSDCRKIGTVTPVLDENGKEMSNLYNCVSWNGNGVKGVDGKIHGLYKLGDNKQWESVADCGSGKMQPMPSGSYLTGSYQCVSPQSDDGQASGGSGSNGSNGGPTSGGGQNAQPATVPQNSSAPNSAAAGPSSAACVAKYGTGSQRLINGACSQPTKPQSKSASAGDAVPFCEVAWFYSGPNQKPSLDNRMCIRVEDCKQSEQQMPVPFGFKAAATCIDRVEPDMKKYSMIQDGAAVLERVPDDKWIGYKSVKDCSDGQTAVLSTKSNQFGNNYVCPAASASKGGRGQ